ncbi:MAG: hypothetical protein RBR85_01750 [Bacilli bacterium]|jgi:hypothetical protein|nr:hypothetical protein [Bacilli bacterium]
MKFKFAFPVMLLGLLTLTSCVAFENDPGEYSIFAPNDSSEPASSQDISYYDGDNITLGDYANKKTIDCQNTNLNVGAYYSEQDDVLAAMHQDESEGAIILSVETITFVGVGDGGLLIGHPLESKNGILSFNLNGISAKAIKIHAQPRSNETSLYGPQGGVKLVIDEAALSVNDSNYIKLRNNFERKSEVEDTVCSFLLPLSGTSTITISCYNMQAIIHTIDIFY